MNQRPQGLPRVSKAVTGFLQFKAGEGLSAKITDCAQHILTLMLENQQGVDIAKVIAQWVCDYLNSCAPRPQVDRGE